MSHWAVFLATYNYTLVYRPGKLITHADALSHCPLPMSVVDPALALSVLLVDELNDPLTAADIAAHFLRDPVLAQDWVARAWPLGQVVAPFVPYKVCQHELSVQLWCLL